MVNQGQSRPILKRKENEGLATLDTSLYNSGLEQRVPKVHTLPCCAFWSHLHSLERERLSGMAHRNDLYPLGVLRCHRWKL